MLHTVVRTGPASDTTGWREVRPHGRVVGAFFDDRGRLVGLDSRLPRPAGHRCANEGWDCSRMAIEAPPLPGPAEVLVSLDFGFGSNLLTHAEQSPLLWAHDGAEGGF